MSLDPFESERSSMVRNQIESRGVNEPRVLDAMRFVPRHLFVPLDVRDRAYLDAPQPIGEGQTISQPYIVALMTSLLNLRGDEKVLEIGTGSGYQAAVLARLVREVYTIEIIEPLSRRAQKTFQEMGLRNVHARIGDGYQGWPEAAPFDAIVVTAAPEKVPQPLLDQLHRDLFAAIDSAEVRERIDPLGFELLPSTPQQFRERVQADLALYAPLVREGRVAKN